MNRLVWCTRITNGISLVDPSDNLSSAYFRKAEAALDAMHSVRPEEWKITAGYYALYFSLYAVLMKIGIRSENHVCTIELMRQLLDDVFAAPEIDTIERARRSRVDNQYYTMQSVTQDQLHELTRSAPEFLVRCKTVANRLTEKDVARIRKKYQTLIRKADERHS